MESPSLEIFKTHLDKVLCSLLWVTLLRQGVGLADPQRSLPTPTILSFCDYYLVTTNFTALNPDENSVADLWQICQEGHKQFFSKQP